MLTSHNYLLGGLIAVACTTGTLMRTPAAVSSDLPLGEIETTAEMTIETTVDVSYRGSGRVDGSPVQTKHATDETYREKLLVSHRGSGRVSPSLL